MILKCCQWLCYILANSLVVCVIRHIREYTHIKCGCCFYNAPVYIICRTFIPHEGCCGWGVVLTADDDGVVRINASSHVFRRAPVMFAVFDFEAESYAYQYARTYTLMGN